ncbi:unnamed protein product, partial [Symbiodinium necroappetens]
VELSRLHHRDSFLVGGSPGDSAVANGRRLAQQLRRHHRDTHIAYRPHHATGESGTAGAVPPVCDGLAHADSVHHLHAEIPDLGHGAATSHCVQLRHSLYPSCGRYHQGACPAHRTA